MLRTILRLSPSFTIPMFSRINERDVDLINKPAAGELTGWERVKGMYSKSEFGEPSKELHTVVQSTCCGLFFGGAFGGLVKSRHAYLNFIENNQATIFNTTRDAQKKLQNYVTVAFAKGAYLWGWRLGLFTGMFSLIATTISVYRNDTSISEYVIAGAVTGAIYKANLGTAAMLVGGMLGAVLSTVGGLLILGILKVSGTTMDDIRAGLYMIKESRQSQMDQVMEKGAVEKHDELTRNHDLVVGETGAKKLDVL